MPREAAAGVAFLIGHNSREMPFGQTLTGSLIVEGDVTRVLADAYTLTEPATEVFINRVRAGIQKDELDRLLRRPVDLLDLQQGYDARLVVLARARHDL